MDKRSLIAIVLSVLVIIAFQMYSASQAPKAPARPAAPVGAPRVDTSAPAPPGAPAPAPVPSTFPPAAGEEKFVRVETELYTARLSSMGGTVAGWRLKKFDDQKGNPVSLIVDEGPVKALAIGWDRDFSLSNVNFRVIGGDLVLEGPGSTGSVVFELTTDRYSVRRTYTFRSDGYDFELADQVSGLPDYFVTLGADFGVHLSGDRLSHSGPVLLEDMKRIELTAKKLKETRVYTESVKWIAVEDKYFFSTLVPRTPIDEAFAWKAGDSAAIGIKAAPGESRFMVYAGPKEHDRLKALGSGLEHIVDFGFFSILARPIFWLLKKFHLLVGNYGWAIVLLTIVIRVPFIPIVQKGQNSMKRLQEIQPRMQEIKEKFKKDPQRMQQEMMTLYKKHKVNPMGGCLPMLLQIPVFFALYKVLMVAIELRGTPFMLWITDLSQKDPYYILPIIMGVSMLVQQKMTPSAGDPRQQKIMMFMPVIFTFMFLSFPSGLVLYWLVNNLLSIAQQAVVNMKKS